VSDWPFAFYKIELESTQIWIIEGLRGESLIETSPKFWIPQVKHCEGSCINPIEKIHRSIERWPKCQRLRCCIKKEGGIFKYFEQFLYILCAAREHTTCQQNLFATTYLSMAEEWRVTQNRRVLLSNRV